MVAPEGDSSHQSVLESYTINRPSRRRGTRSSVGTQTLGSPGDWECQVARLACKASVWYSWTARGTHINMTTSWYSHSGCVSQSDPPLPGRQALRSDFLLIFHSSVLLTAPTILSTYGWPTGHFTCTILISAVQPLRCGSRVFQGAASPLLTHDLGFLTMGPKLAYNFPHVDTSHILTLKSRYLQICQRLRFDPRNILKF